LEFLRIGTVKGEEMEEMIGDDLSVDISKGQPQLHQYSIPIDIVLRLSLLQEPQSFGEVVI
jgi:hypothetical protein